MLRPGQLVDQYKVRARIGAGGMGEVYLARDVRLGRKVALKVVLGDRLDHEAVSAFLEEARVTARFSHPHIVAVYGAGEVDGRPYLALEYLEGATLREQLEQARLPVGRAVRVAHSVAQALAEAHDAGVLHRDLKPENVFLPRDGRVRVVDFGLARSVGRPVVDPDDRALDTQLAGTPLYMAPEQWRTGATSAASDVWAFGLCLYEMLAGVHPFADGDGNIARLRSRMLDGDLELPELPEASAVSVEVHELLSRCLAAEPGTRPSARQIVQVLDAVLQGRSATDEEEPPYRGLLPFTEAHAAEFHGREAELALFVERLRTEATLPVVGPSGAGKSSFVGAGVLPRLREQAFWTAIQLRPGRTPIDTLASRLVAKETQSVARVASAETMDFTLGTPAPAPGRIAGPAAKRSPAALAARIREHPSSLHVVLAEIAEEQRTQVVLVIDQLEELFTLVEDEAERRAFLTALCTAADDPEEPIRVLFTVRDDFLGRLAEAPAAAEALARVALIRPLGRDALRDTLIRPLQARGYGFDDPRLVDEMVDEVADSPAGLPLLQFAARMLWDRRDRRERLLRRRDYEAIGGVAGALARHGDEVLAGMGEERREVARQLLLRLLGAEGTRRTIPWSEAIDGLPAAHGEATLERLVGSRLLVVREGEDPLVELAHESLVEAWSRLRRWHAESREEVRLVAELEDAARLWERRGRRQGELWSGETLMDAERVMGDAEMPLSSRARTFLDLALDTRDRAVRTRRVALGAAVGALAVVALGSTLASVEYARQRSAAVELADRAQQARAEALAAGAHAAWASGDLLAARAQLRSALTLHDGVAARALWSTLDDAVVTWRLDTPYWPHGHHLSADASRLTVAASDGILRRFDLRTGAVEAWRTPGDAALARAAVTDSGDRLAAVDFDGAVWIWDGEAEGRRLDGVPDDVYPYHLEWLGEDRLLLYVYWPDGFATATLVWTGPEGAPERVDRTTGHGRVAISGDRRWLVSGNPRGGEVSRYGLADGSHQVLGTLDRDDRVGRFAWHPDGKRVVAAGRQVVVFDGDGGVERRFDGHPAAVRAAGFIEEGRALVALGADGRILVWDFASGRLEREVDLRIPGDPKINGGEVLPGGRVHVNRESGLLHVDLTRGGTLGVDRGHIGFVEGVAPSPDGRWIASGGQDGTVRVWSVPTGEQVAVLSDAGGAVADLRFSPDGRWLVAGPSSGDAVIWSSGDWSVARSLDHPGDLKAAVFTEDSGGLVTGDYGGWVRRWDLRGLDEPGADVTLVWSTKLDTNLFDLDLVPGSDRFVATDFYGRLYNGRLGQEGVRSIEAHRAQAHTVIGLGDGRALSIGFDDAYRVWDLDSGSLVYEGATEGATGIGATRDGSRVLLGTKAGTVLRDVETDTERLLPTPDHGPSGVRFFGDGRVAVGDDAGTLRIYDVETLLPLWSTAFAGGGRVLTHRGWTPAPAEGAWAVTLTERGWVGSADGATACLLTRDGRLELWDRRQDALVGAWPVQGARGVVAQTGRCLVRTGSGSGWWTADGRAGDAPDGHLVDLDAGWAAVLGEERWWLVPPAGAPEERAGTGVTAVHRGEGRLWVGTADGGFEAHEADGTRLRPSWVRPPASAVVALASGPGDTVFSAHRDGQLVLWDMASGARLLERKLHGPPLHLQPIDGALLVATEVGDVERIELRVFASPRCALLRQVEAVIPTTWEDDRIQIAAGPADCR